MSDNKIKTFNKKKLKWGAIKEYEGVCNSSLLWTFKSYIIFSETVDGRCFNVVNQDEVYDKYKLVSGRDDLKNLSVGDTFVEELSGCADIVLYRAFNIDKKDYYTVSEIEDAILATEFYFKDKERILEERNKGVFGRVKQKLKTFSE